MRNGHNREPVGNYHRSFKWHHRWPPATSSISKWGSKIHPKDQVFDSCCHLVNMIEDIDRMMSSSAKLLWPSFVIPVCRQITITNHLQERWQWHVVINVQVNGSDLRTATHDQAVDVIRNATSPIRFLVQSLATSTSVSKIKIMY